MAPLALCALLALTCARAEISRNYEDAVRTFHSPRSIDAGVKELMSRGCMYAGRWFAEGVAVRVRDSCLRCRCARGALSCARAACAPAPAAPPRRCALLHRQDSCCPELHCPDGVTTLELEASSRLEEESWDIAIPGPAAPGHACAEEGGVFAAGSALAARAACETCFCLRGARRCVRPRCLPPPPACAPRPAPAGCCPARYYCHSGNITTPTPHRTTPSPRPHDCKVNGEWVSEGEQVSAGAAAVEGVAGAGNCSQCFCLRGRVRCQPLGCAPALRGCTPLLRAGHCCPHQYHCPHRHDVTASVVPAIWDNSLTAARNDERSFRSSASTKTTTAAEMPSTKTITAAEMPSTKTTTAAEMPSTKTTTAAKMPSSSVSITRSASVAPSHPATTKVKRKTNDSPPITVSQATTPTTMSQNVSTTTAPADRTTQEATTAQTTTSTTAVEPGPTTNGISTGRPREQTTTEQPDGSVKMIINGTINCTAELSSTLSTMATTNDTKNIQAEAQPRNPDVSDRDAVEAQTSSAADIITDKNFGVGFEDGDSFIVNVTSSLNANTSHSLSPSPAPPAPPVDITAASNMSKKNKEDYDYDYMEPTLPPSLPNLKIIPFVAADAVVDEDGPTKEESLTYPVLEREDKFPVYYPSAGQKETPFATRREDVYNPTQYPVFVSEKRDEEMPLDLPVAKRNKVSPTLPPATTRRQTLTTPEVNLFSPPVETEGGFVPKGPGIIDEYYAVYPTTPAPVPHLTTSMQINPGPPEKLECVTVDGRRVPEGESVWLACSSCACAWGELHCAPRRCVTPPGCRRRPAKVASADLCCGDLICGYENSTTLRPTASTQRTEITLNITKVPIEIEQEHIPFRPPPDRREPAPSSSTDRGHHDERHEAVEAIAAPEGTLPTHSVDGQSEKPKLTNASTEITDRPTPATPASSTPVSPTTTTSPAAPPAPPRASNDTGSQSQEYDDDDDDDEGFSFGSVLKLLLSDNYDTTTAAAIKKKPTAVVTSSLPTTTVSRLPPSTTKKPASKPTAPPFIPMQPHAYIPPQKLPQNALNRIDHLVLGEATAIKKTTPRPASSFRPVSGPPKRYTTRVTTRKPLIMTSTTKVPTTEETVERYTPQPVVETARPAGGGGTGGAGLLKLAGCNIYGRMYRVGRIITELSTPCQECRCTELGVQCAPLRC